MDEYAEIIDGVILQTVRDGVAFTTADGTQHSSSRAKNTIANMVKVVDGTTPPAPNQLIVGVSVVMIDGLPTRLYTVSDIDQKLVDLRARNAAMSELTSLDTMLDRATEDLITALDKWDDPALNYQKMRRDRKNELRIIIKNTDYLTST